jgi:hypothetical protein
MKLKEALDKMKLLFSGVVTPEKIEEIRAWVKLQDTPASVTLKELTTKDGKKLSVKGELIEGAEVTIDGAPAPDADYIIVDAEGKEGTITVVAGKVTKIVAATPASTTPPATNMSAEVKAEFEKLRAELATRMAAHNVVVEANKTLTKQVVELSNHMVKILSTPINLSNNTVKIEKKYDEMTNFEKVQFNRGEKIYHNG